MKLQSILALFIMTSAAMPSAEPTLSTRQISRVTELIDSLTSIVEQFDTAVKSFTCDPHILFSAQFTLQQAFRAIIQNIKAADSITLTESVQIQAHTTRLQNVTDTLITNIEAKKPVFDTFGFTTFMVAQLSTQRWGMIDFDKALVDRMPEEAKSIATEFSLPIINALQDGAAQMRSGNTEGSNAFSLI
ncbi:hypothetical protein B0J14DRAFT_660036 [Halenospora varia]|nr:hypothetical protein B0J14DRAFT_660036 [Halenospora varia]